MGVVLLSLLLAVSLIVVSLGPNEVCNKLRGAGLAVFGKGFEYLTNYVPSSLRRTYPAVISLCIANFALLSYAGDTFETDDAIIDTWAVTAIILFIIGWLTNRKDITFNALWVNVGLWAAVSVNVIMNNGATLAVIQVSIFCVSYMFLSLSAWWLMRLDPDIDTDLHIGFLNRRGND